MVVVVGVVVVVVGVVVVVVVGVVVVVVGCDSCSWRSGCWGRGQWLLG